MGKIIDGRSIAESIKEELKVKIQRIRDNSGRTPLVASIIVGNDGGSVFYVNNQQKVASALGIEFEKIHLEENIKEETLIKIINELNNRNEITGIILQLPLPQSLNEKNIISTIAPEKDIDCLTYVNQGRLYMGEQVHLPCTPNSVVTLLSTIDINLEGKEVVVIGRSNIVGKPLANLMLNKNCTVTICHSKTRELELVCKRADILISAIGKPKFITSDFVKKGAVVIDVGTSSVNGKITGDVDFDAVIDKASYITPVPGGVGALTTTLLLKNACEAMLKNED